MFPDTTLRQKRIEFCVLQGSGGTLERLSLPTEVSSGWNEKGLCFATSCWRKALGLLLLLVWLASLLYEKCAEQSRTLGHRGLLPVLQIVHVKGTLGRTGHGQHSCTPAWCRISSRSCCGACYFRFFGMPAGLLDEIGSFHWTRPSTPKTRITLNGTCASCVWWH